MGELAEETGQFIWGLAKGVIGGAIKQDFEHHYEDEVHQHPTESFGVAVGHAVGATLHDIFNPFSSN